MLFVFVLIAYATGRLARFLRFKPKETLIAILLVLLLYVGSFIYMMYKLSKVEKQLEAGLVPESFRVR